MAIISPVEYEQRIRALEKLNATLSAEIDRQRPVVEAARRWYDGKPEWSAALATAVMIYEAQTPILEKSNAR